VDRQLIRHRERTNTETDIKHTEERAEKTGTWAGQGLVCGCVSCHFQGSKAQV
jgi:hypothetical protein